MKKFKKTIMAALTAAMAISAVPAINSSAAQAANNEPKMYLDFTIESDGDIRADVVIENMPDFTTSGFHVELGEGLKFTKSSEGRDFVTFGNSYTSSLGKIGDHELVFATMQTKAENFNGHFVGFYVERTDVNNAFNSTGNVVFYNTPNAQNSIVDVEHKITVYDPANGTEGMNTPEMLESNEYLVGDVDGDGVVDGIDATLALSASKHHGGSIRIEELNGNYTDEIPDLRSAYAADVNKDGYISQADADLLLKYYTIIISGMSHDGNIGKVDIYEIYND